MKHASPEEYKIYIKQMQQFQKRFDEKYQVEEVYICPYCGDEVSDNGSMCCKETHAELNYMLTMEDESVEYLDEDQYSYWIDREFMEEQRNVK